MGNVLLWLIVVVALAPIAIVVWSLHRLAIVLEERGYLYYRKSGGGGGIGGAFLELDKLTRPSVQHVVEAEDFAQHEEDHAGGE